jgi:hypothetical protein
MYWVKAGLLVAPFVALVVWWPGHRDLTTRWLILGLYLSIYLWGVRPRGGSGGTSTTKPLWNTVVRLLQAMPSSPGG